MSSGYNQYPNQFDQPQYQPGHPPPPTYDNFYPNQYNPSPQGYPKADLSEYIPKYENVGDFSPFYIAITICTIIGLSLFILNIFLGCCSNYSEYWNDRHTGNRWIISLWTATPHKQPALDYSTELQEISSQNQIVYHHPHEEEHQEASEFLELRTKRESEI